MQFAQLNPAVRRDAAFLVDLSDRTERERLGSDAARAFVNIMDCWKIRDADARRLLGDTSRDVYHALKAGSGRILDEDQIRRISCLVGIFKALNVLYSEGLADRWMQLPNKNRIFAGKTPYEYLAQGGLPTFATVRRLLDARRGGC